MKTPIALILLAVCSACATRPDSKSGRAPLVTKSSPPATKPPNVRTSEVVKAYPVGRYTDPNVPDVMHERHTVYRREETADWNFLPDAPYALPLGPTTARSNPSPSFYVTADRESMNAQQRAYSAALLEQNRALKKRLETDEENGERVRSLEREIEQLRHQLDATSAPTPTAPEPEPSAADTWDDFSAVEPSLPAWDDAAPGFRRIDRSRQLTAFQTQTP